MKLTSVILLFLNGLGVLKRSFRKVRLIIMLFILICTGLNIKAQTPFEIWNWNDLAYLNTMLQESGQAEWNSYGQKAVLMQNLGIPGQPDTYGNGAGCTIHTGDSVYGWFGYQGYTGTESGFNPAITITACGWDATTGWIPIGKDTWLFRGEFSGQGFEISGLWISRLLIGGGNYQGLFGDVDAAIIKDLGVNIGEKGLGGFYYVGGVVGMVSGSLQIINCYTTGEVKGSENVGGIVGVAKNIQITNCYSTCKVIGTGLDGYVGGLVGFAENNTQITDCYATGRVNGTMNVGGLVGYEYGGNLKITNCYATGDVTGTQGVGGLVGCVNGAQITGSYYAIGEVTGTQYVGGLVGMHAPSIYFMQITNCYALGANVTVRGSYLSVGRILGRGYGIAALTNNHALKCMKVNGGIVTGTATNNNGADISAEDAQLAVQADLGGVLEISSCRWPGVFNTQVSFICPGQVTVTYDLNTELPADIILYYSHNNRDWLVAQTVTGDLTQQTSDTGKTITWNNSADNIRFGKFYFKVETLQPKCVMINSVCWATRNVDAPGIFVDNPEDGGMFYQWNRNRGWSLTGSTVTGWDSSIPTGTEWERANDPSPEGYRVPTLDEIQKLLDTDEVNQEWTTVNGVAGMRFTDRVSGASIFLPAAGYRGGTDGQLTRGGRSGYYWSSTQDYGQYAYYFDIRLFDIDVGIDVAEASLSSTRTKNFGFSVRPVAE